MFDQAQSCSIYNAIAQLEQATKNHNATFDEANKIFVDTEQALEKINLDYWYPHPLSPRVPVSPLPLCIPPQPFSIISYQIGFLSKRLVVRKINSDYDYERDSFGNLIYNQFNSPYTKKLKDDVGNPILVSDSSREIRVMVIENLPQFINSIRSYIMMHTQTLEFALGNIRSNYK